MSNNNRKPKKKKRGKKRNATDLLSTNNSNNNTNNPRSPKRQRTAKEKYDTTIQTLLRMSESDINKLPKALKKHAIEMRNLKTHNHNNNTNHNNNVEISDDESESEYKKEQYQEHTQQKPINHTQPNYNDIQMNNNRYNNQAYDAPHTLHSYNPKANRKPFVPVTIPQQPTLLRYNRNEMQNEPSQYNNHNNNYYEFENIREKKERNNYSFCGFLWFICMILLFTPLIQWFINNYWIRYCDPNISSIGSFRNSNCIPCPINAKHCAFGIAKCYNNYIVDTEINQCVQIDQISYKKSIIKMYKTMGNKFIFSIQNGCNRLINYCNAEIMKWLKSLNNLSFEQFCKLYEMEIMISFFILTWNLPIFQCLIIFFWTRMILVIVNDDNDQLIVIYLKILSYFAPITFSYVIWNKIAALLT